jgi:5-formyltetrahydrofolate cyclo-ligase
MENTVLKTKSALRELVDRRLREMPPEEQATASARARALFSAQPLWQHAQSVLFFAPMPGELDVWPLLSDALASGKQVALPRYQRETKQYTACRITDPGADLCAGYFGIREPNARCLPVEPARVDLILVPGVAFDARGHRLGRGKGFYDRLLAAIAGTRCGVAFEQQMVEEIPVEPHDAIMDYVLLPNQWVQPPAEAG